MKLGKVHFTWLGLFLLGLLTQQARAAEPVLPPGIKTFSSLPRSFREIRDAHEKAAAQACDYLLGGKAVEINDFAPALTERDEKENSKLKSRPNPSTRRQVLTVGVEVAKEDQAKLPRLSAGKINEYLNTHYVSFQAKIQKDAGKGTLYLHHRPIAATSSFSRAGATEDFNASVADSVRNFHSLGLYLPAKTAPTPENLRCVAMIHKHMAVEKNPVRPDADRLDERYEFLFIRARPGIAGTRLDLHVFFTTDERRKLHYLKSGRSPARPSDCTLKAEVMFTKYDAAGLEPMESAMRRQMVNDKAVFEMAELDAFTKRNIATKGDALDNLLDTLDAILDGKVKPSAASSSSSPAKK